MDPSSSNACCSRVNCIYHWGSTWVVPLFTLLLLLLLLLAVPCGMWDPSSPTRDRTRASLPPPQQWKRGVPTTGPAGNSPPYYYMLYLYNPVHIRLSLNSELAFPKLLFPLSPPQGLLKIDIKIKNFCFFQTCFLFYPG